MLAFAAEAPKAVRPVDTHAPQQGFLHDGEESSPCATRRLYPGPLPSRLCACAFSPLQEICLGHGVHVEAPGRI